MANVLLNWTAPTTTSGVDGIRLFRVAGTSTPACTDFVSADAVPTDALPAGSQLVTDVTANLDTDGQYLETQVSLGNWYYGAFSYNDAGFSPCSVSAQVDIT